MSGCEGGRGVITISAGLKVVCDTKVGVGYNCRRCSPWPSRRPPPAPTPATTVWRLVSSYATDISGDRLLVDNQESTQAIQYVDA